MAERGFEVKLGARVDQYVKAMEEARRATGLTEQSAANLGKVGGKMQNVGSDLTRYVTAPLVAVGVGAAAASVSWESAWAGVTKTVEGTTEELASLEGGLRSMAKELPATHGEIASVAEAAGALGVETESILGFTRVMIDLGETTNLTSDQAATSFARIANVMGTAQSDFDRMGSTVVALGNNGASTEAEIVELANRLAAAGAIAGLSEADIFAFSETLASVGVEAEAGGTALSKVFTSIRDSVIDGGDKLETFASTAGMTSEQFVRAFQDDPATAIASFVEGLGEISASGQSTTAVFEELELTDQRLMRALLSTGEAGDYLRTQIDFANTAWQENTALQDEAAKRYETTAAKLGMLRNQAVDLGITLGDHAVPALQLLMDGIGGTIALFESLPGPVQAVIVGLAALAAGVGPVIFVAGTLIRNLRDIRAAMNLMHVSTRTLAAGTVALGGVLTAATVIYGNYQSEKQRAKQTTDQFVTALKAEAEGQRDVVNSMIATELAGEDFQKLFVAMGVSATDVARYIRGESIPAIDELIRALDGDPDFGLMLELAYTADISDSAVLRLSGRVGELRDTYAAANTEFAAANALQAELNRSAANASIATGKATQAEMDYISWLRRRSDESNEAAEAAKDLGMSDEERAAAAERATRMIERTTEREVAVIEDALNAQLGYIDEAETRHQEWADSINGAFESGRSAVSSFSEEAMADLDLWQAELAADVMAIAGWQNNLLTIASQTSPEFAAYLASMGLAGAGLAQEMAGNGDELQESFGLWSQYADQAGRDMAAEMEANAELVRLKADLVAQGLSEGLINGIIARAGDVNAAVAALSNGIVETTRYNMRISSPSKVMRDLVGIPIVQGIAAGIIAGTPEARIEALLATNQITDEMADALRENARNEEEAANMAARVAQAMISEFERQQDRLRDATRGFLDVARDEMSSLWAGFEAPWEREDLDARIASARQRLAQAMASGNDIEIADATRASQRANYDLFRYLVESGAGEAQQAHLYGQRAGLSTEQIQSAFDTFDRLQIAEQNLSRVTNVIQLPENLTVWMDGQPYDAHFTAESAALVAAAAAGG